MRRFARGFLFLGLLAACVALAVTADTLAQGKAKKPPARKPPPAPNNANELSLEVAALEALYELEATPEQLRKLADLARDTAARPRPRKPARASAGFVQALTNLRAAYLSGDEKRIDELSDKLDKLRDAENPEFDDDIILTTAARSQAPRALQLFTAGQLVSYAAAQGDDLTDPVQEVREALDDGRKLTGSDWKELRDETAQRLGWLVVGLNVEQARKVSERVAALLDRGHRLKEAEFAAQWPGLEKEVRQIVGELDPLEVVRHYLQHQLAELLSNPQLSAALAARLESLKD